MRGETEKDEFTRLAKPGLLREIETLRARGHYEDRIRSMMLTTRAPRVASSIGGRAPWQAWWRELVEAELGR